MSDHINAALNSTLGSLPLVLGITSHYNPQELDHEGLKAHVKKLFKDFKAKYPHTPLVLLSALTEGADRLVAGVARAMGVQLVWVASSEEAPEQGDQTLRVPCAADNI